MSKPLKFYDATYGNIDERILQEVRDETYGVDLGQSGWLTSDEHLNFISMIRANKESRILEIACGSGRPALRMAETSGARVIGIDINEKGIAAAIDTARKMNLDSRATFQWVDGAKKLPFEEKSFDSLICIDAINHLPDRATFFREWRRVLKPGGLMLFTDPTTVTGYLTDQEIATRASIGFFVFVPLGEDERILRESGLEVLEVMDVTSNMENVAKRWHDAREKRAESLIRIEGEETFRGTQKFLEVAHAIARDRRLSRFAYLARRPEVP